MYIYSAVMYFHHRIGYAEENENKGWYIGKSTSPHLCVMCLPPNTTFIELLLSSQTFVSCFLQRYADIFNHFLSWLAGWDYFTLRLLHGGEWVQRVQRVQSKHHFNMLYLLFVQFASCTLNKVYISSTLILSVVVSILAILPWVQKGTTTLLTSIASFPSFHPLAAMQGGGTGNTAIHTTLYREQVY